MFADYFTTAVRTGDEDSGMAGVSLLLIEKDRKGVLHANNHNNYPHPHIPQPTNESHHP